MTHTTRLALTAALLITGSALVPARAAVDLPMVCTDPSAAGRPVREACGGTGQLGQVYKTPGATDLVRINPGSTLAGWDSDRYLWAAWKDLAPGDWYDRCTTDVPEGALVAESNCTGWAFKQKAAPRAPSFTVSPSSGRAPLTVQISWDVDQGDNCQAGGAWTGAKASAGTQQLTLTAGAATFTLACSRPTGPAAPGSALLTWDAPSSNTDGTPYADPAGYQLYSGTTSPPQSKLRISAPGTLARTVANLAPNTIQYFAIAAVNAAGTEGESCCAPSTFRWIENTPTPQTWTGTSVATADAPPAIIRPKAPVLHVQ